MDSFEEMTILSQRLKNALDSNYNVLNMQVVLEVLACLEVRSDISKEQVESTGLAISINNLRRKTNNDSLAKRSKRLVKEWRKMIPTNTSKIQANISITPHLNNLSIQSKKIAPDIVIRNGKRPHPRDDHPEVVHVKKHKKHKSSRREPMVTNIQNQEPYLISDSLSNDSISFPSYQQLAEKNKKLNFTGCFNSQVYPNVIKKEPQKLFTPHPSLSISNSPDLVYCTTSPVRPLNISPETPPRTLSPVVIKQESPKIPTIDLIEPKKRGRKKGSKGGGPLDIKDMIIKAGKKVKTTAELVYDLGNRTSRHKSQEHFIEHKNASALTKMVSAPEFSAEIIQGLVCEDKQELVLKQEFNLPQQFPSCLTAADQLKRTTIEDEIRRLRIQLPPIDYSALEEEEIEEELIFDYKGRPVVCSCTFKEVTVSINESKEDESFINVQTEKQSEPDEFMDHDSSSNSDKEQNKVNVRVHKVKIKSIFDDDDEDIEDTIQVPAIFIDNSDSNNNSVDKQLKSEQPTVAAKFGISKTALEPFIEESPVIAPAITSWECEEDENCIAAQYFLQQNAFHSDQVQLLHDCFIPLLNGNWNGISLDKSIPSLEKERQASDAIFESHGIHKNVVPNCNHLEMEKLAKRFEPKCAGLKKLNCENNDLQGGFSNLSSANWTGLDSDRNVEFKEFFDCMQVSSYQDEILTILPYVVID